MLQVLLVVFVLSSVTVVMILFILLIHFSYRLLSLINTFNLYIYEFLGKSYE